ncbi:MAG: class I SAM-dependent methyltransferase [Bacteroidia bacterium]
MLTNPAFNALAANYDTDFTNSIIGILQRNKVWQFLAENLPENKSLNILEINCGTGEDALWFANNGHQIIATDLSDEMIEVANKKKKNCKNGANISFEVCAFDQLNNKFQNQQFDLIFSNFAGLNCIDKNALIELNNDFEKLLKPNGKLIMVLLGKKCFLERFYFLLKLDFKNVNRRKNKASAYLSNQNYQDTWYYNYNEIESIFSYFKLENKKPIGLLIPPSYLENKAKKAKSILKIMNYFDTIFSKISWLANYGDHIILQLEKTK